MTRKIIALFISAFFYSGLALGQQGGKANTDDVTVMKKAAALKLYTEIMKQDSLLFNAFNHCDSITYKKYFVPDLEFYHDLGGLTVGLDNELKSFTEMCTRGNHIRRELVKSSVEVYTLKGYGAVEIAIHRFYHTNKGEQEKISGTYKFIHVWQFKDGAWKISRIISYGHDEVHND